VEGRPAKSGADEAIVGKRLRGRFKGVDLGQSFPVKQNRPLQVVGVFEDGGSAYESEVWTDVEVVKTAFRREGIVSSVRVQLEAPAKLEGFKAAVEQEKQLGLEVRSEVEYYERQSVEPAMFVTGMGVLIAVFFSLGAMIGAMITMYAAISNRQR